MNKTCGSCGEAKPLEAFYLNRSRLTGAGKGVSSRCKECHNTDAKHRTAVTRAELRLAAIEAYGGKCSCCGEAEEVFLAIDHVDGGGLKHRRELGGSVYRWLRLQGYPPGFQVLCHNCNWAKYRLGGARTRIDERGLVGADVVRTGGERNAEEGRSTR